MATSSRSGGSTSTTTTKPIVSDDFSNLLNDIQTSISNIPQFGPDDVFGALDENSGVLSSLADALSQAFSPFVNEQLRAVSDQFRATGNESALSGTGGPNRATQVAIPEALAAINQQMGGQFAQLIPGLLGTILDSFKLQSQNAQVVPGLLTDLAKTIPQGSTSTENTNSFENLFSSGSSSGGGGSQLRFSPQPGQTFLPNSGPSAIQQTIAANKKQPNSALFGRK